jgi:hypothetical protein
MVDGGLAIDQVVGDYRVKAMLSVRKVSICASVSDGLWINVVADPQGPITMEKVMPELTKAALSSQRGMRF